MVGDMFIICFYRDGITVTMGVADVMNTNEIINHGKLLINVGFDVEVWIGNNR
ncbi:hypothetical protein [Candidatus Hodgkinia cicadicola]|uniref:hypothetical protein n=1 Tax=Candidatus Hodgkinia cicadicola TaxID=573658 RepID=UPI001788AEE6